MPRYLILRLDGPMQAWGTHTFEDFRPSNLFPTRSGLLGLLGACLGLERVDLAGQAQLAASVIGIPSNSGFIPIASANDETTGAKTITCATLLITSLIKSETTVITNTNKNPLPENCASQ